MEDDQEAYWISKLEDLKRQEGLDTYKEVAAALGMSKQGLANVRRGQQELSVDAKLKLLDLLGGRVAESDYVRLFPKKTRSEVSRKKIAKVFDPVNGKPLEANFWVEKIEEVKVLFDSNSDNELAKSLGISSTMISDERKGVGGLSTVAKFKILEALGYALARDGLLDLLPPRISKKLKDFDNLRFDSRGQKHR